MPQTIGYHFVKSCYRLWLPGDDRGHWSEAWDDQIGYYEPHMLHNGDPVRLRMAQERMKHPPVRLTPRMSEVIVDQIRACASKSPWKIVAFAVDVTHFHLLFTYSGIDSHKTCMWLADQTTKAVHRQTDHRTPVWGKGKWCAYVFEHAHWRNTARYIERHNERRGLGPRPYNFVEPLLD